MDADLSLRGGDIVCGCTRGCCGLNISWYRRCC